MYRLRSSISSESSPACRVYDISQDWILINDSCKSPPRTTKINFSRETKTRCRCDLISIVRWLRLWLGMRIHTVLLSITYQVVSEVSSREFAVIAPPPLEAMVPFRKKLVYAVLWKGHIVLTLAKPCCCVTKDVVDSSYKTSDQVSGHGKSRRYSTLNVAVGIILRARFRVQSILVSRERTSIVALSISIGSDCNSLH